MYRSKHATETTPCLRFCFVLIFSPKTPQNPPADESRPKAETEKKMRGVLKRNGTVSQLLQSHGGGNNKKITDVFANPVANLNSNLLKNQTQSREYFKLADFLRKSTRAYNEVSPYSSLFSSAFAASSARTASFSEVGFVGWYLAMVKSRPVLTKSATCSLIYIAADLSSQVNLLNIFFLFDCGMKFVFLDSVWFL